MINENKHTHTHNERELPAQKIMLRLGSLPYPLAK
jgi:hypothetical protein